MHLLESAQTTQDILAEETSPGPGLVLDDFEEIATAIRVVGRAEGSEHPLLARAEGTLMDALYQDRATAFYGEAGHTILASLEVAARNHEVIGVDEATGRHASLILKGYANDHPTFPERPSSTEPAEEAIQLPAPEPVRPEQDQPTATMSPEGELTLRGFGTIVGAARIIERLPETRRNATVSRLLRSSVYVRGPFGQEAVTLTPEQGRVITRACQIESLRPEAVRRREAAQMLKTIVVTDPAEMPLLQPPELAMAA
jgi:hypothetical protein